MNLPMHSNMLAVYPHILERLKTVPGIKAVKEIGELAELVSQLREKRKAAPLDGAVYVVFGGAELAGEAGKSRQIKQTLYFTFVLCRSYLSGKRSTLYETGAVLTAIQAAFQGWDAGREVAASAFRRAASPPIEYNDGFAFYPIAFAVDVVSVANPV